MSGTARMRASDEDREQIIERLRKAATEGRLAAEELEQRVQVALVARTYGELDALVADLPGARARARQNRRPGDAVPVRRSAGRWAVSTVSHNPALLLFAIPVIAVTAALLVTVTVMWAMLMIVVLALGGRRHVGRPPWIAHRAVRGVSGQHRARSRWV